ncbi:Putative [LysW]-L-2-aminoadipate/[LysW]-L-glutamate phosphate reductase, partial [Frankliniella fusca]
NLGRGPKLRAPQVVVTAALGARFAGARVGPGARALCSSAPEAPVGRGREQAQSFEAGKWVRLSGGSMLWRLPCGRGCAGQGTLWCGTRHLVGGPRPRVSFLSELSETLQ